MGARVLRMSGKLGVAGLVLMAALAGCEKEVILEGERFPVRADLDASIPVEGQPLPLTPQARADNLSQPIALPAAQANAEWTHRGGNARHDAPHGQLSGAPQLAWSVNIGAGNSRRNRVAAAPVVAAGRVMVMDASATVSAVSTAGALLWQTDLTPEFDSGGEISGGGLAALGARVYATTGFGELVALDAASGAVIWRQRFDAGVTGAPAVEGGAVYAVARDGAALAVATDTGRILWQLTGTRSASGVLGAASPAIDGKSVIFPFASGQISAAEKAAGAQVWGAAVAGKRLGRAYAGVGDLTGDLVVSGGVLYVGTAAGRTVAIAADTGLPIWAASEGAMNPPLVVGGSVFVVSDEARLVRLDAGTGAVIWSVPMPYYTTEKLKKIKAIYANYGPVLAGGRVVVAGSDGYLRLFSATDGALVGQAVIPGGAASSPALAGGALFVVGAKGQLHAFR